MGDQAPLPSEVLADEARRQVAELQAQLRRAHEELASVHRLLASLRDDADECSTVLLANYVRNDVFTMQANFDHERAALRAKVAELSKALLDTQTEVGH